MPTFPLRSLLFMLLVLPAAVTAWPSMLASAAQASGHRPTHPQRRHSGAPITRSPWSTPQILGPSTYPPISQVTASGASLTVWTYKGIRARWRAANGRLSPEQLISPPGEGKAAGSLRLAMAPDGTAVIAWNIEDPFHDVKTASPQGVYARLRYADGRLGAVRYVSSSISQLTHGLFLGPADGQPRLVWVAGGAGPLGLFVAPLDLLAGSVGTALPLGNNQADTDGLEVAFMADPAVATDKNGNSVIVWVDRQFHQVLGRIMSRSGSLSPIFVVSRPGSRATPYPYLKVSLAATGVGHVVWAEGPDSDAPVTLHARRISTDGSLGPILPVGRIRSDPVPWAIDVATFSNGQSLVVWPANWNGPIRGRTLAGAQAEPVFRISGTRRQEVWAFDPRVVTHGSSATVMWGYGVRRPASRRQVRHSLPIELGLRSRTITSAGGLGPSSDIFIPDHGLYYRTADIASNASGQMVATWQVKYYQAGPPGTPQGQIALLSARR